MNLGKVKQVRFHQGIRVGKKLISSLNLDNKVEAAEHDVVFSGGLLKISKKKTKGATYVGLANICYMVCEDDDVVNTPVEQEVVSNEKVNIELSDLNANEAIKVVRATENNETLEVWKDIETRASVLKEIDKKLK